MKQKYAERSKQSAAGVEVRVADVEGIGEKLYVGAVNDDGVGEKLYDDRALGVNDDDKGDEYTMHSARMTDPAAPFPAVVEPT